MVKDVRELADLVGLELSAVAFVRDFVEFQFDGPVLRSHVPPVLVADDIRHEFPQAGSRDALCELIGRTVDGTQELSDRLLVSFDGGALVEIMRCSDYTAPEVAHFVPMINGKRSVAEMTIWENRGPK
jgi:hypothetical protein